MDDSAQTAQQARAQAIGRRIIEARRELGGMRQEELAELIGVSVRSMQAYESGEVIPYRRLKELARVLQRPMEWLLHGEGANDADRKLAAIQQALLELNATTREILELLQRHVDGR